MKNTVCSLWAFKRKVAQKSDRFYDLYSSHKGIYVKTYTYTCMYTYAMLHSTAAIENKHASTCCTHRRKHVGHGPCNDSGVASHGHGTLPKTDTTCHSFQVAAPFCHHWVGNSSGAHITSFSSKLNNNIFHLLHILYGD